MRKALRFVTFAVLPGAFAAFLCFWILDGRPPEAWEFYREAKSDIDYGPDLLLPSEVEQEGGHLKPNLNLKIRGPYRDEEILLRTNSKGFRNEKDFSYDVPENVRRILFVGDSYVDGYRTDQSKTIGSQLQSRLTATMPGQTFEILLAGISWDVAAAWRYFQEFGKRYHPQLLLVGITLGNDLLVHYEKREISQGSSGLPSISLPQKQRKMSEGTPLPPEAYHEKGFLEETRHNLEILFRQRFGTFRRLSWLSPLRSGLEEPAAKPFRLTGDDMFLSLGFFLKKSPDYVVEDLTRVAEYLNGLQKLAESEKTKLVYVIFPTRMQVYPEEFQLFARLYGLREESFDLDRPSSSVLAICKSANLRCLDMLPPLRKAARETGVHLYLPLGDMHLNEHGPHAAANAISDFLSAQPELLR